MVTEWGAEGVRILPILRAIVSNDSRDRSRGADAATDLIQEYSDPEALSIAFTLACCYEVERDSGAQEAQLHALAELAEHGVLPRFVLLRVLSADPAELSASAREHLEYLAEVAEVK